MKQILKFGYFSKLKATILLLFLVLFCVSCSESGSDCVEADDYGEYDYESLTIYANSQSTSCDYDSSLELNDTDQGSGLKDCFISADVTVTDEDSKSYSSSSYKDEDGNDVHGCYGLQQADADIPTSIITLCIAQCQQECAASSATSTNEPHWNPTSSVPIGSGSKVYINATGTVSLSDSDSSTIYLDSTKSSLQSLSKSFGTSFIDGKAAETRSVEFSGIWTDALEASDGNISKLTVGVGNSDGIDSDDTDILIQTFNGTRRLVAYIIAHPEYYEFDSSADSEAEGTLGVPLFADTDLWYCTYEGDGTVSKCASYDYSSDYSSDGHYSEVDSTENDEALDLYNITATKEASNLGTIGGMIRWDDDGINDWEDEIWSYGTSNMAIYWDDVSCDESGCDFVNLLTSTSYPICTNNGTVTSCAEMIDGGVIGDASTNTSSITNSSDSDAYRISFKNLSSDDNCDTSFSVQIKNSSDTYIKFIDSSGVSGDSNIMSVDRTSWSAASSGSDDYLILEPLDTIEISAISDSYYDSLDNSKTTNCGNVIGYRLDKIHEIEIEKSGFVSFAILGGSSTGSGTCTIDARIINPTGDRNLFTVIYDEIAEDDADDIPVITSSVYDADFYEYDSAYDFSDDGNDPMSSISVSVSYDSLSSGTSYVKTWSDEVFVRKGQKIRFNPESWDGTWTNGLVSSNCGAGMAMKIIERPAFLCRGNAPTEVDNPDCDQEVVTNDNGTTKTDDDYTETQCQAVADECTDSSVTNTYYCIIADCQTNDSTTWASVNTDTDGDGIGACEQEVSEPYMNEASCSGCATLQAIAADQETTLEYDLIQCYDLEAYTGKVDNIDATTGFTDTELADPDSAKGAVKLSEFDGTYGDFSEFSSTDEIDSYNSNKIYQLIYGMAFNDDGRIKFLILDGDNFKYIGSDSLSFPNSYKDNVSDSEYNGENGFKISLSGSKQYDNGEMLEVVLCEDSSGSDCSKSSYEDLKDYDLPVSIDTLQSKVVMISDDSLSDSYITYDSYYKFDSDGDLVRIYNTTSLAPGEEPSLTLAGDNYYIHTHADDSNLKLAFKIKDTDTPDCSTADPSSTDATTYDGIMTINSYYVSNNTYESDIDGDDVDETYIVSGNTGEICGAEEELGSDYWYLTDSTDANYSKKQCQKQYYCADLYANNSGSYDVTVKVNNGTNLTLSSLVTNVLTPVTEVIDGSEDGTTEGQAEIVYNLIISDDRFRAILQILFTMAITFYGIGYLMGVSEFSQGEIMMRMIKIGIIYLFIGSAGWFWFDKIFVTFFKDGTNYLSFVMASAFDDSSDMVTAIANSDFYDKSLLFSSVDDVLGIIFSEAVLKKMMALLFASVFGWFYLLIIYWGLIMYFYAVANAVLLYITAQVFISILFILGPMFFVMLMFKRTQGMFDKWLNQLIGFSLQQILLLTTLAFFNMLMYQVVKMVFAYRVCWDDVWVINIFTSRIVILSWWTIGSMTPRLNAQTEVGNVSDATGIPSFFSILFIWAIASFMLKFIVFMTDLGNSIGGGALKASDLGSAVKGMAAGARDWAAKKAEPLTKRFDNLKDKLDDLAFDSGKGADERRKTRKEQRKKDNNALGAMKDPKINKKIEEYKVQNAEKLAAMSTGEQDKHLREVKKDMAVKAAMSKVPGMSKEDAEKLYERKTTLGDRLADNDSTMIWGLLGNVRNKDVDTGVNLTMNEKQLEEAMKNANDPTKLASAIAQDKFMTSDSHMLTSEEKITTKNIRNSDLRQAEKEMEADGQIPYNKFSFSRPKEEKERIRNKAKEIADIRKSKGDVKLRTNRTSGIHRSLKGDDKSLAAIGQVGYKSKKRIMARAKEIEEERKGGDLSFGKRVGKYFSKNFTAQGRKNKKNQKDQVAAEVFDQEEKGVTNKMQNRKTQLANNIKTTQADIDGDTDIITDLETKRQKDPKKKLSRTDLVALRKAQLNIKTNQEKLNSYEKSYKEFEDPNNDPIARTQASYAAARNKLNSGKNPAGKSSVSPVSSSNNSNPIIPSNPRDPDDDGNP